MAFRQDEAVSRTIGVFWIMLEDSAEVQGGHDVGAGQRSSRVPAARFANHPNNIDAQGMRDFIQLIDVHDTPFSWNNVILQRWMTQVSTVRRTALSPHI